MEPLGHILFSLLFSIIVYKYVRWKGALLLFLSCTMTDMFVFVSADAHSFMHTVAGFALLAVALSLIFYKPLKLNAFILAFVGTTSHAVGDFIKNTMPEFSFPLFGHEISLSLFATLVPLTLLVCIYALKLVNKPED